MYALKQLASKHIHAALAKAEHYRALNQPDEAESICHDVLAVAPKDQGALKILGLALTDRLNTDPINAFDQSIAAFEQLTSEFDRTYYIGIAHERSAKAHLERGETHNAVSSFERALDLFEKAEKLAPPDSCDAVLRWNRCVRVLLTHPELRREIESPRASMLSPLGD